MSDSKPDAATLRALYAQIEEICRQFKEMRSEVGGIVQNNQMPDAALHLNDVLQATEEATSTILDAATAIGAIAEESAMGAEGKQAINDQLGKIYEASSFQDISGQRIKKVLQHLSALESQLLRLSETGHADAAPVTAKPVDPLLNGPALATAAPTQADIDAMFNA